jgi:hypothetical protein
MKTDGYQSGAAHYQRTHRISKQLANGWEPNYAQSDPQVVPTEELETVLRRASDEWERQHIDELNPRSQYSFTSVVGELAGIDPRIVRKILLRETKYTNLHMADKILTAMSLADMLGNEIHVIPNPNWSQERWQAWAAERGCGAEE